MLARIVQVLKPASVCFRAFIQILWEGFTSFLWHLPRCFRILESHGICCVINYAVLPPLASALQVFGSMNVMEKGNIWRRGTLSNFCGFVWVFFLKKKARPSSVIAALVLPTKPSRPKDTVTRTFPGTEDVQFL